MKQILFVYNPVAGTGRVRKKIFEIIDYYNSNECLVTLYPIRKINDLYHLLKTDNKQYDAVVCSGGDGSLNEVISFFMKCGIKKPIGYIPSGTTNDYANSLEIPEDFFKALTVTLNGNTCKFDLGKFNDKYFLYVAAFGMFTNISYNTPQKAKNLLGHTAYILEGVKQLSEIKSYDIKISSKELCTEGSFILGMITNSLSVGGYKYIMSDDVKLNDGEFEVVLVRKPQNIVELNELITGLLKEEICHNKHIVYFKTSKLELLSEQELEFTLDGEYGGKEKNIQIENLKEEIEIIV